jgi:hypothetical protein
MTESDPWVSQQMGPLQANKKLNALCARQHPIDGRSPRREPIKDCLMQVLGHVTCRQFLGNVLSQITRLQSLNDVSDAVFKDCEVKHGAAERLDILWVAWKSVHSLSPGASKAIIPGHGHAVPDTAMLTYQKT